ncbi:MAG TPA: hypothetical protein VM618_08355 [Acidimicrobiia bacterium]|nr:hypothetical protein [Acidimicrobiia bacterium]
MNVLDSPDFDELFTVPPARFVRTRNATAQELRREGRGDEADAVARLRRPTVTTWGLNQLASRHAGRVEEFAERVAEVTAAQEAALTGDAAGLAAATDRLNDTIRDLADVVAETIVQEGVAASGHRDEVETALRGAVLDAESMERLRAGRLEEEPAPGAGGFPTVVGDGAAGASEDQVERRLREAEAAAARAEERVAEALTRVDRQRETVSRLEHRLDDERDRLADEEQALERAEREQRDAVQDVRSARRRVERSR